jgi:type IV pilus assembly protein PilN
MTTINLLPWRKNLRAKQKYIFFSSCFAVLLLSALLNIFWYGFLQHKINQQNDRNAYLEEILSQTQTLLNNDKKTTQKQQQLTDQVRVLSELHNQRYRVVEILNTLPKLLPNNVYLTQIQFQNQQFALAGKATTDAQITDFINRLKNQPGWKNIQIVEIAKPASNNAETTFQVTLTME